MVRERMGLRIEAEMGKYLFGKLAGADEPVMMIGADARTGVARRERVDLRVVGREQS